jgi:hypothetical protein
MAVDTAVDSTGGVSGLDEQVLERLRAPSSARPDRSSFTWSRVALGEGGRRAYRATLSGNQDRLRLPP